VRLSSNVHRSASRPDPLDYVPDLGFCLVEPLPRQRAPVEGQTAAGGHEVLLGATLAAAQVDARAREHRVGTSGEDRPEGARELVNDGAHLRYRVDAEPRPTAVSRDAVHGQLEPHHAAVSDEDGQPRRLAHDREVSHQLLLGEQVPGTLGAA
jgi:hypothetical protein